MSLNFLNVIYVAKQLEATWYSIAMILFPEPVIAKFGSSGAGDSPSLGLRRLGWGCPSHTFGGGPCGVIKLSDANLVA